jgi:rhodanese-related sulfurtransferase
MQTKSIDPITLKKRLEEGTAVLIDVREPHEHAREHIEGAKLVPLSRFQTENFARLQDKTAVFHCHSGGRTSANARLLTSKGFATPITWAAASWRGKRPGCRRARSGGRRVKHGASCSVCFDP